MQHGKTLSALAVLIFSLFLNQAAFAAFGSIFDLFFHTNQATVYHDHGRERPIDTTFLYEKYSDYYCVEAYGQELCGFDCMVGDTHSDCASHEQAGCVKNDYGVVTCGYDCQVNGHDMRCGAEYNHNCLKDGFGKITCGDNCRCHKGQTTCDHQIEHLAGVVHDHRDLYHDHGKVIDHGHDYTTPPPHHRPELVHSHDFDDYHSYHHNHYHGDDSPVMEPGGMVYPSYK